MHWLHSKTVNCKISIVLPCNERLAHLWFVRYLTHRYRGREGKLSKVIVTHIVVS